MYILDLYLHLECLFAHQHYVLQSFDVASLLCAAHPFSVLAAPSQLTHPSISLPQLPISRWPLLCDFYCVTTRKADCGLDSGSSIPLRQQGLLPVFSIGFFVERQQGWSSERTRLCLLDSPQLGHGGSFSVVVQRRWQHLFFTFLMAHEPFYQNGNQAHFFIVLQYQIRRKKGSVPAVKH